MRICSLLPGATEIAFALGLGDDIVGVSHECDYPPEAKSKPALLNSLIDPGSLTSGEIDRQVGEVLRTNQSIYSVDPARLKKAAPDLILTQGLCDVCALDYRKVVAAAEDLPAKPDILALNANVLSDILAGIELVGNATGKKHEAERLVAGLTLRIERIKEQAARSDLRPRVACLEWVDPIYIAGHWVPEMVELAGGQVGLAVKGQPSKKAGWEAVVEFAPEVIVLMPCGLDANRTLEEARLLIGRPDWRDLPAVKCKNVFAVNGHAYFSRPGPRLVDGLEILAQILHPEIFPWKTPSADAWRVGAE